MGGAGGESAGIRVGAKEERGREAGGGPGIGEQTQSENTIYMRVEFKFHAAASLEHTNVIKRPSPANRQSAPKTLGSKSVPSVVKNAAFSLSTGLLF